MVMGDQLSFTVLVLVAVVLVYTRYKLKCVLKAKEKIESNGKKCSNNADKKLKIAFLHPDLGIGGAERLVVDVGLAYKQAGHSVVYYTNHHDPKHCFSETVDGTFEVVVYGDWMPRQILGKFMALCAYLRMVYMAIVVTFFVTVDCDIMFVDQVSLANPILYYFHPSKLLFYCHFPDQLLSKRTSVLKSLYRWPLDVLEEITTGLSDIIFVNSEFTKKVFYNTFTMLKRYNIETFVLYPSINVSAFDEADTTEADKELKEMVPKKVKTLLLSLNRYERKKDIPICIHSLSILKKQLSQEEFESVHLIIAGGYDERVTENVEHYEELSKLVENYHLEKKVTFLRSVSHDMKISLIKNCSTLIYTPENEHFGIVPIEGMYMKKMVIAKASGGPLETIDNEVSGILCDSCPDSWANAIKNYAMNESKSKRMGEEGQKRFGNLFSFSAFCKQVNSYK